MTGRIDWTFRIALALGAFFSVAGGLGLAALSALAGLGALHPRAIARSLASVPAPLVFFILALCWMSLSLAWSPHTSPDQAVKLAALSPFYMALVFAAARADTGRTAVRAMIVFAAFSAVLLIALEGLFNAPVMLSYKMGVEGYEGTREGVLTFADRMLGRGALPALMLAGPAMFLLWRARLRGWALVLLALSVIAASSVEVDANIVALAGALGLATLALGYPVSTLRTLLAASAITLLLAPFAFALFLVLLPDALREALPLSWAWRLEIWDHAIKLIAQRPIIGHGLEVGDAMDPFSTLRGVEIDLLPLHAHNAALTIWLETGYIGALLWAAVLMALSRLVGRVRPRPELCAMIVYVISLWLVSVMLGFGLWHEWHHGALALGLAACFLADRPLAGNLRP